MARIRNIKPEFFRHEGLQDLERDNPGSYCMLVFPGLWAICDRSGRFEWKPRTIKLDVLPFLEFDMAKTLDLLWHAGFIFRYRVGSKDFGVIPSWENHQTGESLKNEKDRFPGPTEGYRQFPGQIPDESGKDTESIQDASHADPGQIPDESGSCPPRNMERNMEREREVIPPNGGVGGNSGFSPEHEPESKPSRTPRIPSWAKAHPPGTVKIAQEICAPWPHPKTDLQPDGKTPVPHISVPEVAQRLAEIRKEGGNLDYCLAIAARAVQEFRSGGKWIKAPQHFFGKAPDAPWRAYYQAHVTNAEILAHGGEQ